MKCNLKNRPLDAAHEALLTEMHIASNSAFLNYANRLAYISVRENAGFGIERMGRLNALSYDVTKAYVDLYTPIGVEMEDTEYAVDSYYAIRNALRDAGFLPERELWGDRPFRSAALGSERERAIAKRRVEYANTLSFYVREMLCGIALTLHQEFGFGTVRLRRVFSPVAERYVGTMRMYTGGDTQYVMAERRRVLAAYNDMGIFGMETEA